VRRGGRGEGARGRGFQIRNQIESQRIEKNIGKKYGKVVVIGILGE